MSGGFELSNELIETLCRSHGREYNSNYSYTMRDVPGGVQLRVSDPQTGEKIDEFTTYSGLSPDEDNSVIEKDIMRIKKSNSYIRQCITLLWAIMFFAFITSVIVLIGFKYM